MWMVFEKLPKRLPQNSHTAAVNDTDTWQAREKGTIHELLNFPGSIVHCLTDYIDFARNGIFRNREMNSPLPCCFNRSDCRICSTTYDLCDVIAGDSHFHDARCNLEVIFIELAGNTCRFAQGLELYRVSLGNVFDFAL